MRRLTFILRLGLGLVLGLAIAEAATRQISPRLAQPLVWHTADVEKQAHLLTLTDTPIRVLAGTSQVAQGLDPSLFGSPTINVALSGGTPEITEQWLLDEVVAAADIEQVVWGLTPLLDFSATDETPAFDRYLDAFATRPGFGAEFLRQAAVRSELVEFRPSWAGSGWYRLVTGSVRGGSSLDENGFRTLFNQRVSGPERAMWLDRLSVYEFGGSDKIGAVERTVAELERREIELIVVEMPVPNRMIELVPGGAEAYELHREQMIAEMNRLGVRFIEVDPTWFDDSHFLDFTHFSAESAQAFTTELVGKLAEP